MAKSNKQVKMSADEAKAQVTMSADEAKAAAKKAFDSGKTNCPICSAIRQGRGYAHTENCLAKFQRAGSGERTAALINSLSDEQKEIAQELANEHNRAILRYAAQFAKPARKVKIDANALFDFASEEEKSLLQKLLRKQQQAAAAKN